MPRADHSHCLLTKLKPVDEPCEVHEAAMHVLNRLQQSSNLCVQTQICHLTSSQAGRHAPAVGENRTLLSQKSSLPVSCGKCEASRSLVPKAGSAQGSGKTATGATSSTGPPMSCPAGLCSGGRRRHLRGTGTCSSPCHDAKACTASAQHLHNANTSV